MTALEWDDSHLVGHAAIDASHREFADLVNAILVADDRALVAAGDSDIGRELTEAPVVLRRSITLR